MKKDSIIDYIGYIIFRLTGPLFRAIPVDLALFAGRRLGDFLYYFDLKRKARVYSNIKLAFADELSPGEINIITKRFYHNFGQSLIEVLLIPKIDKDYIARYVTIEGMENIKEAFKKKRGVIFLGVHAGSWELSNVVSSNLGFTFNLFVRDQRHPLLDNLLNQYRLRRGCKIISRKNQLRQLIHCLKNNEAVGMTVDQGGRQGILVRFFGRLTPLSSGPVRLALRYGATILPGFYTRTKSHCIKVIIGPVFNLKRTDNLQQDIRDNLQELTYIFERYIRQYPEQYLWSYKIWKYAPEKSILILSDRKPGHLRQAESVAKILKDCLQAGGMSVSVFTQEVRFKNRLSERALMASALFAGKYRCQGCIWCLKTFLTEDTYNSLIRQSPDFVISCGSSLSAINYVISNENLSKSIVVMRPSILSIKRFNLVIISQHDRPPKRKNVVRIEAALNLIDQDYLNEKTEALICDSKSRLRPHGRYLGLLIGGVSRGGGLDLERLSLLIRQIKQVCESLDLDVLVTTSRRSSSDIEQVVKEEFKDYPRCKLLIIANEYNPNFAIGGILGLSRFLVVSPESVSMISEAVSSNRYVIVFDSKVKRRHRLFLDYMAKRGYIYLAAIPQISELIQRLWQQNPPVRALDDRQKVKEAIIEMI
ncbi:MAG: mitochondrial fission ELM1 family protein [Candidatus Omnitrophica bacterium]|nr:mitochondrial fission ELM1 family protein [Candidatus Omnitrophota bacterium]